MASTTISLIHMSQLEKTKVAYAAITPGMLLAYDSTAGKVKAHATATGNAVPRMFALENEWEGENIDTAYAANDQVRVGYFGPGDEVLGILADGQTVVIGDPLESNGAGFLQKHVPDVTDSDGGTTVYTEAVVAVALEAKDLSGSSGAEESSDTVGYNKRIKIEIV